MPENTHPNMVILAMANTASHAPDVLRPSHRLADRLRWPSDQAD